MEKNERFAVIDTETNWDNALMSIGMVISDEKTMRPLDAKYLIITPEFERGGIFSASLFDFEPFESIMRHELESALLPMLEKHGVQKLFCV